MLMYEAHKGVSTEYPENTMPAFEAAVRQGYGMIELDPNYTADGELVVLHDRTLRRTARQNDGTWIAEDVEIQRLSFAQASRYDYGRAFSIRFKGESIPRLQEVFGLSERTGIALKIDSKYTRFPSEIRAKLFAMIAASGATVGLTCDNLADIREAVGALPDIAIHYDGVVDEARLQALRALTANLTVWLRYDCPYTAWAKVPPATSQSCALVKQYAKLGLWLLTSREDVHEICDTFQPDVIETDGSIKPPAAPLVCDMHTHSECSHDSTCPVAEMAHAQQSAGLYGFALTDHCDIEYCQSTEDMKNIRQSVDDAGRADGRGIRVLRGVEIGEAVLNPALALEAAALCHYDVILGSVHAVRFEGWAQPYSCIDFRSFTTELLNAYLRQYFRDVREMLDVLPCDVLAHLTCPLRYITGKFGMPVDLSPFAGQIDDIFRTIIQRGIALEVNTSAWDTPLHAWMPSEELLLRYRALGGYLVTLGSDAHAASRAAGSFAQALAMLRRCGFTHVNRYENRQPMPASIE